MRVLEIYFVYVAFSFFIICIKGCVDFQVNKDGITYVQIDTGVHVPLSTISRIHLSQCIQDCFYVSKCNRINYEASSGTCQFFDITGSVTAVVSPSSTWNLVSLSDVTWAPGKNYCVNNPCNGGESCFLFGSNTTCVMI